MTCTALRKIASRLAGARTGQCTLATDGMLNKLKNLDAYPKVNEDFFTRTYSGGVITVVSSLVMLCLFISELSLWLRMNTISELSVDTSRGEMMDINVC